MGSAYSGHSTGDQEHVASGVRKRLPIPDNEELEKKFNNVLVSSFNDSSLTQVRKSCKCLYSEACSCIK